MGRIPATLRRRLADSAVAAPPSWSRRRVSFNQVSRVLRAGMVLEVTNELMFGRSRQVRRVSRHLSPSQQLRALTIAAICLPPGVMPPSIHLSTFFAPSSPLAQSPSCGRRASLHPWTRSFAIDGGTQSASSMSHSRLTSPPQLLPHPPRHGQSHRLRRERPRAGARRHQHLP